MKKTYIQPALKVRYIKHVPLLEGSNLRVDGDDSTKFDDDNGNRAKQGSVFNWGGVGTASSFDEGSDGDSDNNDW